MYLVGVAFGLSIGIIMMLIHDNIGLSECAKKRAVFECEWVATPVEGVRLP